MPLLIALALLLLVLAGAVVLGLLAMVRRPFRPPVWQPVVPPMLALRAALLVPALGVAAWVTAWRQPEALGALALGTAAGLALGAASGSTARLEPARFGWRQQPRRVFAVLLALAVLGRALAALVDDVGGGLTHGALAPLAGLLLGYPLAHALALRVRVRWRLRRVP